MEEKKKGFFSKSFSGSFSNPFHKSHNYKVIIVGGGISSGYAAKSFVQEGIKSKQLAIFSGSKYPPCESHLLTTEFFKGSGDISKSYTTAATGGEPQDVAWYSKHGVELFLNKRIVSIDVKKKTIVDSDNVVYTAKKALIIATGSITRTLPLKFPETRLSTESVSGRRFTNVFYSGQMADLFRLKDQIAQSQKPLHCIVVGGGVRGFNSAVAVASLGHTVTIVVRSNQLMRGVFTLATSALYEDYLSKNKIEIKKGLGCGYLINQGDIVRGVELENGQEILGDLVIVAVGLAPNIELVSTQVNVQIYQEFPAIVANAQLETNVPGIYGIGPVISPLFEMFQHSQLEFPNHSQNSGTFIAKVVMSKHPQTLTYQCHPFFSFSMLNRTCYFWGEGEGGDEITVGNLETDLLGVFLWEDRVVGAFLVGGTESYRETLSKCTQNQSLVNLISLRQSKTVEEAIKLLG